MELRREQKIFAVASGIVKQVSNSNSFGKFVSYVTDEGYEIFYGHLQKIFVKENSRVKKNQIVALSGQSGFVTGPHLHYSIRFQNEFIDPIFFVDLPYTDDVKNEYYLRGESIN